MLLLWGGCRGRCRGGSGGRSGGGGPLEDEGRGQCLEAVGGEAGGEGDAEGPDGLLDLLEGVAREGDAEGGAGDEFECEAEVLEGGDGGAEAADEAGEEGDVDGVEEEGEGGEGDERREALLRLRLAPLLRLVRHHHTASLSPPCFLRC